MISRALRRLAATTVIGTALVAAVALVSPAFAATTGEAGAPSGLAHARSAAKPGPSSPELIYHGGPVMSGGAVVKAILWGSSWTDASFVADKITGLASFYGGIGGSAYAGTTTEYTDASGAHVSPAVTYAGDLVDTSAAPRHAPKTSAILAEVAKEITNPVPNGYYPVYTDTPRGSAGFCAWHFYGTVQGVVVQFAFFFNLDGDPGCDPRDTSGRHSEGLAALANVSGHELSETLTDPHADAWYSATGENGDKCAWTFGSRLLTFKNRSQWKVQGNWSNAAYDAGTGYVSDGQLVRGCIDGTNN